MVCKLAKRANDARDIAGAARSLETPCARSAQTRSATTRVADARDAHARDAPSSAPRARCAARSALRDDIGTCRSRSGRRGCCRLACASNTEAQLASTRSAHALARSRRRSGARRRRARERARGARSLSRSRRRGSRSARALRGLALQAQRATPSARARRARDVEQLLTQRLQRSGPRARSAAARAPRGRWAVTASGAPRARRLYATSRALRTPVPSSSSIFLPPPAPGFSALLPTRRLFPLEHVYHLPPQPHNLHAGEEPRPTICPPPQFHLRPHVTHLTGGPQSFSLPYPHQPSVAAPPGPLGPTGDVL
ncbi:unnamed protein product [Gadus morhua 'NCC']